MLSSISWGEYFLFVGIAIAIYYFVFTILFYRNEIAERFTSKRKGSASDLVTTPSETNQSQSTSINSQEDLINSLLPKTDVNPSLGASKHEVITKIMKAEAKIEEKKILPILDESTSISNDVTSNNNPAELIEDAITNIEDEADVVDLEELYNVIQEEAENNSEDKDSAQDQSAANELGQEEEWVVVDEIPLELIQDAEKQHDLQPDQGVSVDYLFSMASLLEAEIASVDTSKKDTATICKQLLAPAMEISGSIMQQDIEDYVTERIQESTGEDAREDLKNFWKAWQSESTLIEVA
jgi:hypothetical protein